ncbi:hypothetical protein [Dyadobacter sediminis]|uniref:Uncharacterized protein n=1 Tax=Dyadobacter sediminis TaxID=1493691 RepID=A0A5R9KKI9_9BACT|nr:hypothetical protein [Dyadobacter sediminis]TLU96740.1 hypothetical protein FEM55_06345 [Dyadobacter sediminis]GGB84775.1 hypothetical protein GCM10011325_10450 [Dyadobacter sediminis]
MNQEIQEALKLFRVANPLMLSHLPECTEDDYHNATELLAEHGLANVHKSEITLKNRTASLTEEGEQALQSMN